MNSNARISKLLALVLCGTVIICAGCRRVTLVGDSLIACALDEIVCAINNNDEDSFVYTQHVWGGSTAYNNPINKEIYRDGVHTAYNNPINKEIYRDGVHAAFGVPDAVVFSFGGNDMGQVLRGSISFSSAVQSMQTLINQAVVSGAQCIVMLESSHKFRASEPSPINDEYQYLMDEWFDHWHSQVGVDAYLGMEYTLLIADISDEVQANMDKYIADYIHFTKAGAELAAAAIVEQVNQCPEGRWEWGENRLKPGAHYHPNPYVSYGREASEEAIRSPLD
jgi:lysophospholipase L1-like esterase